MRRARAGRRGGGRRRRLTRGRRRARTAIEIFFFDRPAEDLEIDATARGQLADPSIGEARAGAEPDDVSGALTLG
jgi:hypothetical protein